MSRKREDGVRGVSSAELGSESLRKDGSSEEWWDSGRWLMVMDWRMNGLSSARTRK